MAEVEIKREYEWKQYAGKIGIDLPSPDEINELKREYAEIRNRWFWWLRPRLKSRATQIDNILHPVRVINVLIDSNALAEWLLY